MAYDQQLADVLAENERLRAFIQSLDGKTICIRCDDGKSFVDDGIIVASDILGAAYEQSARPGESGDRPIQI